MTELFSLQGKMYTAVRDPATGKPGTRTWLGNVSAATMALATDKSDKNESFSGNRLLYGSLQKSKSATLSLTVDEWLPEGLALALYGISTDVAGSAVTAEAFPSSMAVGDQVQLAQPFATSIVIKDSTSETPLVLTAGTDYEVVSATLGLIQILSLGSYVQPFHAAYTAGDASRLVLFSTNTPPERYVTFDGINTNTGEPIIVDLYRVQFDPAKELGLIDDDWGGFDLSGSVLFDTLNAQDATLGGFGRMLTGPAPSP